MKKKTHSFRVEFRHPKGMHPTWSFLPEHADLSLSEARTIRREHRCHETPKRGGFQQRIVRTTTTEAVVC